MKKITLLSSFLLTVISCFGQITTVLKDLSANSIGDSYQIYGLYQNAVSTTRGTATVAADPAATNGNCIKVVPTSGNHLVLFSVVIPSETTLASYSTFSFDLYPSNVLADGITSGSGARYSTALAQIGSSCTPGAAGATALLFETATVDKGASNTWHTISVNLSSLSGLNAYSGTQNLFIGLYSNNNTVYYLDNIKIAKTITALEPQKEAEPLIIYSNGNTFKMNKVVDNAEVFDINGRRLLSLSNVSEISTSQFSAGVYVVKASSAGSVFTTKIVK